MKTEELINRLAQDPKAYSRWTSFSLRFPTLLSLLLLILGVIVTLFKFRSDYHFGEAENLFVGGSLLFLLIISTVVSLGTSKPDWANRNKIWVRLFLTGILIATVGLVVRLGDGVRHGLVFGSFGASCAALFWTVASISSGTIYFFLKSGLSTRPNITAFACIMGGIASGLLTLELHCGAKTLSHILVGHWGAVLLLISLSTPLIVKKLATPHV